MNRVIDRLKIVFLIVFAVAVAAVLVYQIFYVGPANRCADRHEWLDRRSGLCAHPLYLPMLTGRAAGVKRTPEEVARARARLAAQP